MSTMINCHPEWDENFLKQFVKNFLTNFLNRIRRIIFYKWVGKDTVLDDLEPYGIKVTCGKDFKGVIQVEKDNIKDNYNLKIDYQESSKKGKKLWEILIPEIKKTLEIAPSDL